MRACSCLPSPKKLQANRGCLSIKNNDERCFPWSILASLHPLQYSNHPDRVSKYQGHEHNLKMSGIQYPEGIKDISKFEHQNNISVIVYGYKDKKIFPLRITSMKTARHHVSLLYITTEEASHYVLVKELSRLVSRQHNNDNHKKYF